VPRKKIHAINISSLVCLCLPQSEERCPSGETIVLTVQESMPLYLVAGNMANGFCRVYTLKALITIFRSLGFLVEVKEGN
jgi:hypothetical protein